MGGFVGYMGNRESVPVLMETLSKMEYRGYDSAGVAVRDPEGYFNVVKTVGHVDVLRGALSEEAPLGHLGLGHTRWRTHGAATTENAQPHLDCHDLIAVVQNGIVENHRELKAELSARGHRFISQTDAEVLPHLIEDELQNDGAADLETAVRAATKRVDGTISLVAARADEPETLVAMRSGYASGLAVGWGQHEVFISTDVTAIASWAHDFAFLMAGEMVRVTPRETSFTTAALGRTISKRRISFFDDPVAVLQGGYLNFMLKEITEQPEAWVDALRGRVDLEAPSLTLSELDPIREPLTQVRRVVLTGSSSSFHAAQVGRLYLEELTGLPSEVEVGSEVLYGDYELGPQTLVIALTQSGETADTLAVLEEARHVGSPTVAVTNVASSTAVSVADCAVLLRSGPEVGIVTTKTFTSSLLALYLISLHLGQWLEHVSDEDMARRLGELARVPRLINTVLSDPSLLAALATRFVTRRDAIFLGHGYLYPIAREGAWKLMQLAYIHADAYPGSEIQHGPITLIDGDDVPTIAIAPRTDLYDRMVDAIRLVKDRGGTVIAIISESDDELAELVDYPVFIPKDTPKALLPVITTIPLQLFAYYTGIQKGTEVDEPRNISR